jgi:hypothetical protein
MWSRPEYFIGRAKKKAGYFGPKSPVHDHLIGQIGPKFLAPARAGPGPRPVMWQNFINYMTHKYLSLS